ncbi:PREDICTED: uncharacterized protein LOC109462582 [Branchiostoma belcheri]|uniref:Uncharacterized protein LOC109462582 n=1 Tax=Branchiostoma belcheri TaxID=7741 RepID=A0A6P4Y7H8_BRABE|nr:PREDICTED: uncharacterized protein LOC109462582 [Branchiostoma belcheri]
MWTNGNSSGKLVFFVAGVILGYSLCLLQNFGATVNIRPPPDYYGPPRPCLEDSLRPSGMLQTRDDPQMPQETDGAQETDGPRKILLDCGANVASTVQLFRETYPDGKDYIIHSFELDARLAPYFASYSNHVLHCPVAVGGKDGNITAYAESAWKPDKGKVAGRDMQWGGGAIYASDAEKRDEIHGRRFGVKNVIPMVDLSKWIQENTALEDYVIFKLDVEGAEYEILEKMIKEGTFKWIDKFYGEFHGWTPVPGWSAQRKEGLRNTMRSHGINMLDWAGEYKRYQDIESIHKIDVPADTPGAAGVVYSTCSPSPDGPARLALTVQVGMNRKAAHKLVETIRAHPSNMPVTLFVYGDFVQDFPDLITKWADRYTIGTREAGPFPADHWVLQNPDVMRMSLVSAVQRMKEVGLRPAYYYPDGLSQRVQDTAKNRGLRIIQPTTKFPPNLGTLLKEDNYYRYRDVERTPKALRILYERISTGGILSLDTDHPDSYMISAFLMDYLYENSGFQLVSLNDCLRK